MTSPVVTPPADPRRRTRVLTFVLMGIALAVIVVFDLCGTGVGQAPPLPTADAIQGVLDGRGPAGHEPASHGELPGDLGAVGDDARILDWEQLSAFECPLKVYELPADADVYVPDEVRALSGAQVVLAGYMVPLEMDGAHVKRFLLSRYPLSCCFNGIPKPNEIVDVEMAAGSAVETVGEVPVIVRGRLVVRGEKGWKQDAAGVFQLAGDLFRVAEAPR